MPEEKILRLGEWFTQNGWQYSTNIETSTPALVQHSGSQTSVTFNKTNWNVVRTEDLMRLFKDYDKYIDDRLQL